MPNAEQAKKWFRIGGSLILKPWTWAGTFAGYLIAEPANDLALGKKDMTQALHDIHENLLVLMASPLIRAAAIPFMIFCFWAAARSVKRHQDKLEEARKDMLAITIGIARHYGEMQNLSLAEKRLSEAENYIAEEGRELDRLEGGPNIPLRGLMRIPAGEKERLAHIALAGLEELIGPVGGALAPLRDPEIHFTPLSINEAYSPDREFDPALNKDFFSQKRANLASLQQSLQRAKNAARDRRSMLERSRPDRGDRV